MTAIQQFIESKSEVREIREPSASQYFRAVSQIWHFPSGDVLLERDDRRDCLLPAVDRVDVPVTDTHRVSDALALETDTTVRVVDDAGTRILTEYDDNITID